MECRLIEKHIVIFQQLGVGNVYILQKDLGKTETIKGICQSREKVCLVSVTPKCIGNEYVCISIFMVKGLKDANIILGNLLILIFGFLK